MASQPASLLTRSIATFDLEDEADPLGSRKTLAGQVSVSVLKATACSLRGSQLSNKQRGQCGPLRESFNASLIHVKDHGVELRCHKSVYLPISADLRRMVWKFAFGTWVLYQQNFPLDDDSTRWSRKSDPGRAVKCIWPFSFNVQLLGGLGKYVGMEQL